MAEMAGGRRGVVGSWLVKVTLKGVPGDQPHLVAMTFTEDGGMVETAGGFLGASNGTWEPGRDEDVFNFTFYRFLHDLTATATGAVTQSFTRIQRVRSTNRLTGPNAFRGEGEGEILDLDLHVLAGTQICTLHDGARMVVEPIDEECR